VTKYRVELTATAERVYRRIFDDANACLAAGDESNSKVKQFRMVDEMLDKVIPHDPFAPERALSGPLSGIVRVKKARLRICYAASSKQRTIVVLYISDTPRKAGDANDPYAILTKLVMSGKYDSVFDRLGVRSSNRPR
jgi:mRNA-degrading endonuclease RelE of RelBE toxin-antitoxin system